jgi:two-component system, response regulator PdtaR
MKKVLIVEDDSILAFVHQKFVEQLGYKVTACVESGAAAIEEVKKDEPDIILMDILILGDMDGIETMGEIRKFSAVPVVYVTGNSNPTVKQRADATPGKVDFLSKPINLGLLQTTFHKLE